MGSITVVHPMDGAGTRDLVRTGGVPADIELDTTRGCAAVLCSDLVRVDIRQPGS